MRIVSLLPALTEIICALGLEPSLVGVTHECDFPGSVRGKPVLTQSVFDQEAESALEIDQAVLSSKREQLSLYQLDYGLLNQLQPDLILTQTLCDVCALPAQQVAQALREIGGWSEYTRVLSFEPLRLNDMLASIEAIGVVTATQALAQALCQQLQRRIDLLHERLQDRMPRPRVAYLEWLDPLYGPGHWVPELISLAGGAPGLGRAAERSQRITWDAVIAFAPEVIVLGPCGRTLPQALEEARELMPTRTGWESLPAVRNGRVYVVDANAYFSRPGPRLIESLEILAQIIHPTLFTDFAPPGSYCALTMLDSREQAC